MSFHEEITRTTGIIRNLSTSNNYLIELAPSVEPTCFKEAR